VEAMPNLMVKIAKPLLVQWSLGGIKNSETSQVITKAIMATITAMMVKIIIIILFFD
jgi:hypothetical protein